MSRLSYTLRALQAGENAIWLILEQYKSAKDEYKRVGVPKLLSWEREDRWFDVLFEGGARSFDVV
jgi:hypothetical protein